MDEEDGIRIVLVLDGSELIVVGTEEGLLPVEFVSRSLEHMRTKLVGERRFPHLVEVCTRFRGYRFENLHILNEELTSCIDLCQIGTILPTSAEGRVDHALSPSRV